MPQGYLIAHVFTSDASIPVPEATVIITQKSKKGLVKLLATLITDESGKTQPIAIPTPELAASQAPSQERPFSIADVTAEHPLYERILVEDVQIFPDTVSVQNLQFIPLDEAPEVWNQTEIFNVLPQNL